MSVAISENNTVVPEKGTDTKITIDSDSISAFHTFEWKNISYEIPVSRKNSRQLLKNVSGSVASGEMVAIMGSSGAGKTTLLNCLSGRLSTGTLSGSILLDKQPRNPKTWRRQVAFVEQEDILFSNITVRETISYAARLRLPNSLTKAEKLERAEHILKNLRLTKAADTRIGGAETRGVSGGEKKRTAIAQELVGSPDLIFLDEPTSGLDSNSALAVIENVKSDAIKTGRIVVATIHQPSWELLSLFDKIILLSGGSTVYFGSPDNAIQHFASIGYQGKPHQNPADFFMDLLTIDSSKSDESVDQDVQRINALHAAYNKLDQRVSVEHVTPIKTLDVVPLNEDDQLSWANDWFTEFGILFERAFLQDRRDIAILIAGFIRSAVLVLLIGFAFFQLKHDQRGINNRFGILFFWPINQVFTTIVPIVLVFPLQRAIMMRERAAASYRVSSFFLSKILTEAIPVTFFCVLTCTPLYFMLGLRTDSAVHFFYWILIQWAEIMAAVGLGFLIGSAVPSVKLGNVVAPLVGVVFLVFGGGLLNNADLPNAFKVLQWLSPINYALRANMINEFAGATFECVPGTPCYPSGDQVLSFFSVDNYPLWGNIGALFGLSAGYLLISYVLLRVFGKPKSKLV